MSTDLDPESVTGTSNEAVVSATGRNWAEWMALLDEGSSRSINHKELVAQLGCHTGVSAWRIQQIAVAYENSRGLRRKYEMPDGYQIGRNRTMAATSTIIYNAWLEGLHPPALAARSGPHCPLSDAPQNHAPQLE